MALSAIKEHIVRTSVLEACSRHGIPHDSQLRRQLESEAEIPNDGRNAYVRTTSGVSLDQRIDELSKVAKFATDLPAAKPTVDATDMQALSDNFDGIRKGTTVVVK